MGQISSILRNNNQGGVMFWCPGCKEPHAIGCGEGNGPRWQWNGDVNKPTFTPSIHVRTGHFVPGFKQGDTCWCTYYEEFSDDIVDYGCKICHSFVTDGKIQFLEDSTHHLKGMTVDLPEWNYDLPS